MNPEHQVSHPDLLDCKALKPTLNPLSPKPQTFAWAGHRHFRRLGSELHFSACLHEWVWGLYIPGPKVLSYRAFHHVTDSCGVAECFKVTSSLRRPAEEFTSPICKYIWYFFIAEKAPRLACDRGLAGRGWGHVSTSLLKPVGRNIGPAQ